MANLNKRIEVNLKGFNQKLKQIGQVTSRTLPRELNQQMLQLIVGGKGQKGLVHYTKKATSAQILADLSKNVGYRLPGGQFFSSRLSRVLAAQWLHKRGDRITRAALDAAEQAIIKQRVKSRAFIAASWLWSARALAPFVPGNTLTRLNESDLPTWDGGRAKDAFGKTQAAKENNIRTIIFNTAGRAGKNRRGTPEGAIAVARKAIPKALASASRSMGKYIAKKWGEEWARLQAGRK